MRSFSCADNDSGIFSSGPANGDFAAAVSAVVLFALVTLFSAGRGWDLTNTAALEVINRLPAMRNRFMRRAAARRAADSVRPVGFWKSGIR